MNGDDPQGYTIQQLAEKAGVSVRTIRFYMDEGLLAVPPVKGRYSVFSEEYLDRLELIRRLKDAFLPLKEIRDRLASLSWEEVKQALAQPQQKPAHRQVSERGESALNYITQVLSASPQTSSKRTSPAPAPSRPVPPAEVKPETWERHILAPGVELHIRVSAAGGASAGPVEQRLARQVINYARKLFHA